MVFTIYYNLVDFNSKLLKQVEALYIGCRKDSKLVSLATSIEGNE